MEKNTFSLRLKPEIIQQFQKTSKSESITQGDLFEKMLNLYLGKPVEGESIPFQVGLFWINNIDKCGRNLDKKIYKGYGTPLYISGIFSYGISYSDDFNTRKIGSTFENGEVPYRSTELAFFYSSFFQEWSIVDTDVKIQQMQEDFKITNPQNFRYISAFRVFKEIKNDFPVIMVNEQMYFISKERYSEFYSKSMLNAMSRNSDSDEILFSKDLDLAVSTLYEIKNLSEGEDKLRLDRKYLNAFDKENLRNILKPTISKNDDNFEDILAEYSIFNT